MAQAKIEKIKGSKKAIKVGYVSLWLMGRHRFPILYHTSVPLRLPTSLPLLSSHTSSFPSPQNPLIPNLGFLEVLDAPEKVMSDSPCPQVFSSAKYPAPEHLQEYSSIFTGAQDFGLQRRPRHRIQSKHRPLDERALQV